MRFTVERREDIVVFTLLNNKLDSEISANMKAEILIVAQPDIEALILDLSKVEYLDSAGLGVLLLANRQLDAHNIPLILVGVKPHIEDLLKISQIHDLFDLVDTVEDAFDIVME